MTRADLGPYMRELREHYGLTEQDVSDRLHIRHRYIHAIEHGAFDQMPGRAYAKGYVHTYAEFLGLDADQAVEICFGPELVREQQKHFVPEPMKRGAPTAQQWRGLGGVVVVLALLGLLVAQVLDDGSADTGGAETVAEVPEDLLADMRRLFIATPRNHDCLAVETTLGCLFDGEGWRQMMALVTIPTTNFAEKTYAGPLPETENASPDDADQPEATPSPKPVPKKPDASPSVKKPVADAAAKAKKPAAKEAEKKPASPDDAKKPAATPEKKPAA